QVRLAQVRLAQVGDDIRVLLPPLVPAVDSRLEDFEVLLVGQDDDGSLPEGISAIWRARLRMATPAALFVAQRLHRSHRGGRAGGVDRDEIADGQGGQGHPDAVNPLRSERYVAETVDLGF